MNFSTPSLFLLWPTVTIDACGQALKESNNKKIKKASTVEGGLVRAFPWCMIPTSPSEKKSSTLNHKPQLGPQHRHHHDRVQKNEISYAVGLMRSIAYRRIRHVNRKTAICQDDSSRGNKIEMGSRGLCTIPISCDSLRLCYP